MTPIQFAKPASEEFEAAIRWYEQRSQGLGAEFYDAIVAAMELTGAHPEIGATRSDPLPTRQFVLQRFPYKIVSRVRSRDLYVVAIAHTSRRPDFWQNRP